MIEKHSEVLAFDPIHGQNVFVLPGSEEGVVKTASFVKEAGVSDKCAQFIDSMEREPGHAYVLVNAMGASEYWGPNRNHDAFPESGLKFGSDDYGYRTFMNAHNFCFHDNKDPAKAVGSVKFAQYNDNMHRVELILDTDLKKLADVDMGLCEKVSKGDPVDVSMGSKCDFDVCTKCGSKAANRTQYCECLKKEGGMMLENGVRVAAYTPHPRFFDISYVKRGADSTAKSLQYVKAASVDAPRQTKVASAEVQEEEKAATFSVPKISEDHAAATFILQTVEPRMPAEMINKMAEIGYNESLSTLSHLGIILKPEEYQRLTLVHMGMGDVADEMDKVGAVINPMDYGSWHDPSIKDAKAQVDFRKFSEDVVNLCHEYIPERTIYEPYMSERLAAAALIKKESMVRLENEQMIKSASSFMTPELAIALGLGYLVYRKTSPTTEVMALDKAMKKPGFTRKAMMVMLPLVAAGSVVDKMLFSEPPTKLAGVGSQVVLPVGATFLYSAYAKRKMQQGQPIGPIEHLYAKYPVPMAIGGVLGMTQLKRALTGRTVRKQSAMMGSSLKKEAIAGDVFFSMASGIYGKPRLSNVLGATADAAIIGGAVKALSGKKPSGKVVKPARENLGFEEWQFVD